ncbi:MAG: antibiotic biosynthesis monooxygenase [Colwellia sp.]|nr:antibiotic biosynthesis monooxygenase [Colwellia sp.]
MSVTVILEADVKPESKSKLLKLLSQYLPETTKYKGFISIAIHSEQDTNQVVFYEKWQSIDNYHAYLNWRTETGVMKELADTFNSPPSIRYFNTEKFNDNSV